MATAIDTDQEGIFGSENLSSAYLEPVTSEEEIDYSKVYALFTFIASLEGQISVLKGEPLDLLDDSNSYWWVVKCISTADIGYIPAENIETPFEKLARFNRSRNVELTEVKNMDLDKHPPKKQRVKKLKFMEYVTEIYEDEEIETELSANPENNRKTISSISFSDDENMLVGKSSVKKSSFMNKIFRRAKANISKLSLASRGFLPKTEKSLSKNVSSSANIERRRNQSSLLLKDDSSTIENINVEEDYTDQNYVPNSILRVFAGPNVKFNATFKSVSFDKDTLIGDLLAKTIKKFRARQANAKDYYLTATPIHHETVFEFVGERILLLHENINSVLDSYGVLTYNDHNSDKNVEKVRQANEVVKITIHKYENNLNTIPIRIFLNDSTTSWEKIEVEAESLASNVIKAASEKYQLSLSSSFFLLDLSTNQVLEADAPIKILAQEAAAKDQVLALKLITEKIERLTGENMDKTEKVSRLDPGRRTSIENAQEKIAKPFEKIHIPVVNETKAEKVSRLDPGRRTSFENAQEKMAKPFERIHIPVIKETIIPKRTIFIPRGDSLKSHIPLHRNIATDGGSKTQTRKIEKDKVLKRNSRISKEPINFDKMLSYLDEGIQKATKVKKSSVQKKLDRMEVELDNLIMNLEGKANGRNSQSSARYNSSLNHQEEAVKNSTGDLHISFKNSTYVLNQLESKLNGMVSYLLVKNRIIFRPEDTNRNQILK